MIDPGDSRLAPAPMVREHQRRWRSQARSKTLVRSAQIPAAVTMPGVKNRMAL